MTILLEGVNFANRTADLLKSVVGESIAGDWIVSDPLSTTLSAWNEKALRRACPPSLTGVTLATNFGGARLGASGSFSTWAAALRRV